MKRNLTFITLLSLSTLTSAASLEADKRIMIEAQHSTLKSASIVDETDQEFSARDLNSVYGNIGFDLSLFDIKFKSNAYFNVSESSLYANQEQAVQNTIFPTVIVTRDLFKGEGLQQTGEDRTQYLINQFEWEYGDSELKFYAGRMWIDFGSGKYFNPLNPFKSSQLLSNQLGVEQAVDGLRWEIARDPKLKLHIYLLADRRFEGYREKITRTAMIRGEWTINEQTKLNYILGEDQQRHKYGFETAYTGDIFDFYMQLMRYTKRLDLEEGESVDQNHAVAGTVIKFNPEWSLSLEAGKNHYDDRLEENNEMALSFIPIENYGFTKLARALGENQYEASVSYLADMDSDFNYTKFEISWNAYKNITLRYSTAFTSDTEINEINNAAHATYPEIRHAMAIRVLF